MKYYLLWLSLMSTMLFAQETPKLTLKDCVDIGLKTNTILKQTQYQLEQANQDVLGSYSDILPAVSGGYFYSHTNVGPSVRVITDPNTGLQIPINTQRAFSSNYSVSVRATQNIYNGGRWWNIIRSAKISRASSNENYQDIRQTVILNVMQKYYDLLKVKKLRDVAEEAVKASKQQVVKAQSRYEIGSAAKGDVYKAQVALGNDRINLINQENGIEFAKVALNDAMGRDVNTPIDISEILDIKNYIGTMDSLIQVALQSNQGYHIAKYSLDNAEVTRKLNFSGYLPSVGLSASYSKATNYLDKSLQNFDKDWTTNISLSLSYTFFNGFQREVNYQKAKLAVRSAEIGLEQQKRKVISDMKNAYLSWKSQLEVIKVNEDNVISAEEDFRLATERYAVGAGTELERRDAQVNLLRAKSSLVQAQYGAMTAYAGIEKVLGKLREPQ